MICDITGLGSIAVEKKLWVCHGCTAIFAGPQNLVPKKCPSCGEEKLAVAKVSPLSVPKPPAPPAASENL